MGLYLKTYYAVSVAQPLWGCLNDLPNNLLAINVSQGAISNMLKRTHQPFAIKKDDIIQDLGCAEIVASDETGIENKASKA